jgi:hypothetical protein
MKNIIEILPIIFGVASIGTLLLLVGLIQVWFMKDEEYDTLPIDIKNDSENKNNKD